METVYINTDFTRVRLETGQHVEYAELGNEALKQLRKNFKLKIDTDKELLCSFFNRNDGRVDLEGFHTHLSRLDLMEDKEMFAAAERSGRSVSVDAYLKLYPLPEFTPETKQALAEFARYRQFKNINVTAIAQDEKGNFLVDADAIEQALIARYSMELKDEKKIKVYRHAETVAAAIESLLKLTRDYHVEGFPVRTADWYFTIHKDGSVTVRPNFLKNI